MTQLSLQDQKVKLNGLISFKLLQPWQFTTHFSDFVLVVYRLPQSAKDQLNDWENSLANASITISRLQINFTSIPVRNTLNCLP